MLSVSKGLSYPSLNLVSNVSRAIQYLLIGPFETSWVCKICVEDSVSREKWTCFSCVIANCNCIIEMHLPKSLNTLWLLIRNVDANLMHRLNNEFINSSRFQSSAVSFIAITIISVEKCFSHLRAGRVVRAYEKDSLLVNVHLEDSPPKGSEVFSDSNKILHPSWGKSI